MKPTRRAALQAAVYAVITASVVGGISAPAQASTFDANLYGRWLAKTTTTTGTGAKKVTTTKSVTLTFSANNNMYYEAKTTVNGKDGTKAVASGLYQVVARGFLKVSLDPTLGDPAMDWQYGITGSKMYLIDENGANQTFTKISS